MHASLELLAHVASTGNACCETTRVNTVTVDQVAVTPEAATTSASLSACVSACLSRSASASVSASISPSASASVSVSAPSVMNKCMDTEMTNAMTMQTNPLKSCSASLSQADCRNVAMSQTLSLPQALPPPSPTSHVTTSTGLARRRAQACSRPRPQMSTPCLQMHTQSILSPMTDRTMASVASPKLSPVSVPMRPHCAPNSLATRQLAVDNIEHGVNDDVGRPTQFNSRIQTLGVHSKKGTDIGPNRSPNRRAPKRRLDPSAQTNPRPSRVARRSISPNPPGPAAAASDAKSAGVEACAAANPTDDSTDSVDVKKAMR